MKTESKRDKQQGEKPRQPQPQTWPGQGGQPSPQRPVKPTEPATRPVPSWPSQPGEGH